MSYDDWKLASPPEELDDDRSASDEDTDAEQRVPSIQIVGDEWVEF